MTVGTARLDVDSLTAVFWGLRRGNRFRFLGATVYGGRDLGNPPY